MNEVGAITGYIDVAQVVLYVFWVFFFGLVLYLQVESKREGFPLETENANERVEGFPPMPKPKTYNLYHGGSISAPMPKSENPEPQYRFRKTAPFDGAPIDPDGDPMTAGVGPGAYALMPDRPALSTEGKPRIVPMRTHGEVSVAAEDSDPRGMQVVGCDGVAGGTVVDCWVDLGEEMFRYWEVELAPVAAVAPPAASPVSGATEGEEAPAAAPSSGGGGGRILLPVTFSQIDGRRGRVQVNSIRGDQFRNVPRLANPDQVTLLEEEKICAFYGAGTLYATAERVGPWL